MVPSIIHIEPDYKLGPAMQACTEGQQRFVIALLESGGRNRTAAAAMAGYEGDRNTLSRTAYRLAHDARIQAALREEGQKRLGSAAVLAASYLVELIENPDPTIQPKDKLKAVEMVLNRVGMHAMSEHKVTVENITDDEGKIARIIEIAKKRGLDPRALLGDRMPAGPAVIEVVDAEVVATTAGLEDLLG